MSRLRRRTRRADDWASPHERARTRAAQRLDFPLAASENAWLEDHLAGCAACSQLADEYLDIRDRLRSLRASAPPPPRDLWARTAAAIEHEARRGRGSRARSGRGMPLGAMSGVLVIAVVLGATLLSNLPRSPVVEAPATDMALGTPASSAPLAAGTPYAVDAGDVAVVSQDADGSLGYNRVGVDEVCPKKAGADCPMAQDAYATALAIDAEPETIIGSPTDQRAVVVTSNGEDANDVIVFTLPEGSPVPTASAEPSVEPTASASATVSAPPSESAPASEPPSSASPAPDTSPGVTPSAPPSTEPSAEPSATPAETAAVSPSPTPESLAIASGLIVVGQTAAFSPDGNWFAFTARPADGSHGPDIYVWRVGDERAEPITEDHRSVFASWTDGTLVGSRPGGGDTSGEPGDGGAEAFLVDPATGAEEALAEPGYRPIVSPDGDLALVFDGDVSMADGGSEMVLGRGSLELRAWTERDGTAAEDATVVVEDTASPFDARWDESGNAFAVWIQDSADPSFGRLSLYFIDPVTGELQQPENTPQDEPALPGFSIGAGRLAWASPAGQDGEGSRVRIVAWSKDGVGTTETAPGDRVVVVR